MTWYFNHTITNELNVLLSKRLTDQLFWYLQPLPIKENHPDTFQFCCCGLYARKGGGEMLWAGCQDIAVGNPPVRRERSSACPSLTSTAQCTSLYTSSVYISKHLGSDFVKTISGNQMCCTLAKYWISRWRQGLQADRIPLATLCGLVRCVALTHAPGHRPLNKRDQCCFFSMASNFFLVLYLNATNAKCAMF